MLVRLYGAKCIGIDAVPVTVEVDVVTGIGIHLVGLADVAVKESLLRTVTALQSIGYKIPGRKIVINLAPADLRKNGSGYDLPIAVGIVAASGQTSLPLAEKFLIMGELGLDGSVRQVQGTLPFVTMAEGLGLQGCILPLQSALEAADAARIPIFGVEKLEDVFRILSGEECSDLRVETAEGHPGPDSGRAGDRAGTEDIPDFADIVGQALAKRGVEIAAGGGHNIIMIGPPGSGKSLLAKAMAGILPPMDDEEALTTRKIYSTAGKTLPGFRRQRPFRSPHYSATLAAIIGGGSTDSVRPGEVSLAHGGILFLDEFGQMPKSVVEALRGPLEDRKVVISRLQTKVEYPCSFMLVAASNPCPCGYYGDGERCTCTPSQRLSYLSRLSGPVLDRIDLQLRVSGISAGELVRSAENRSRRESSAQVAARVRKAREIQLKRFSGSGIFTNAEMSAAQLEEFCPLSQDCRYFMERIIDRMGLSARAYSRVRRIARTIADLEAAAGAVGTTEIPQAGPIRQEHLAEAVSYRFLDRKGIMGL